MDKSGVPVDGELKEVNLLDYFYVIVSSRKVIFWVVGASTLLTVLLLYLIIPRSYRSSAVIMPPKQKSQFSVSAVLKNIVPLGGLGLGKASEEMYNFTAILESRSCMEEMVRRFDLVHRYNVKNVERAIKELAENASFTLGQDDVVLEVTAYDTDPQVAADMANAFVDVLNVQYLRMTTMEAKSNREFLERRLEKNQADLALAEEELRDYQKRFGVYSVPEQVKAAIGAAAAIKSQVIAREVEYGILRRTLGEDDPRIQTTKIELSELNKKLRELKYGGDTLSARGDVFSPFQQTPELAMQYLRRFRDVEIQQKVMEILFPLVEQAKIEEHRDTPTILVLDSAVPSEKPSKPKRMIITIAVFLGSLVLSVFLVFVLDYLRRAKTELQATTDEKLRHLTSQLHWRTFFYVPRKPRQASKHIEG
jgi:tyrosine-protein kinase Etk/Wzc